MRIVSAERLTHLLPAVPEAPRIVCSGNAATPWTLMRVLDETLATYTLHLLNPQEGVPDRDGVTIETPFVGVGARASPRLRYVPARLSLVPTLYQTVLPPDVVCAHTSVPKDGRISLGTEVNVLPAAVEAVRARGGLVIAQLDPSMPYVYGDGELALEEVDLALEASDPLGAPRVAAVDDVVNSIATQVVDRIGDGATLQMGIGEVPDAIVGGLLRRRALRVWSEMFSDGVLALERAGSLDPDVSLTASFVFGSPELYAWADSNPRLRLLRTETTNDPSRIAANPAMISINTALQVDLYGQVNASRINGRIHSGFGGQTDFIVGALHSPGGKALIALRSWHPRADVSTIVPMVEEPVTSFQPSAVVTEQGVATLWGRAEREQAHELIEYASHPDIREELREEAVALGLMSR
jgi:acyl-CoA hydrolase